MNLLKEIPLFSKGELERALRELSKLRCADMDGLVVEMVKFASALLKEKLLHCFNHTLRSGKFEDSWSHTIFQMLPKTGDLSDIANWRPIAILPILYKIFARLIYNRISSVLFS